MLPTQKSYGLANLNSWILIWNIDLHFIFSSRICFSCHNTIRVESWTRRRGCTPSSLLIVNQMYSFLICNLFFPIRLVSIKYLLKHKKLRVEFLFVNTMKCFTYWNYKFSVCLSCISGRFSVHFERFTYCQFLYITRLLSENLYAMINFKPWNQLERSKNEMPSGMQNPSCPYIYISMHGPWQEELVWYSCVWRCSRGSSTNCGQAEADVSPSASQVNSKKMSSTTWSNVTSFNVCNN